jgi:hypothetical protein
MIGVEQQERSDVMTLECLEHRTDAAGLPQPVGIRVGN